jgi:hypothetical protein
MLPTKYQRAKRNLEQITARNKKRRNNAGIVEDEEHKHFLFRYFRVCSCITSSFAEMSIKIKQITHAS